MNAITDFLAHNWLTVLMVLSGVHLALEKELLMAYGVRV